MSPSKQLSRTAEISGAGLVGMTLACSLAERGWKVTVHERQAQLRDVGAGLSLWGNGVAAIRDTGALERGIDGADTIRSWKLLDHKGRVLQDEWMAQGDGSAYAVLRPRLHQALQDRARELGVDVWTESRIVRADALGKLVLESGEVRSADLVVGADGVHSPVRDTLGLTRIKRQLNDGGGRHLIDRRPDDISDMILEQWDGGRRIGIVPCTPDQVYIYLCCAGTDRDATRQTESLDAWKASFPELAGYIDRIPMTESWRPFTEIYTKSWSAGNAAIVGDAANAMTPNLGQAACVGMSNAVALAQALEKHDDIGDALRAWEESERALTEHTQRYSGIYGRVGTRWPRRFQGVRSRLVRRVMKAKRLQAHINQAARHVPSIQ